MRNYKTMKCECGEELTYSTYNEAFNCPKCSRCYNYFGQELRPFKEWKDEWFEDDY